MKRLRPVHALLLVAIFVAVVVAADFAIDGGFGRTGFTRVGPDEQGRVVLDVSDLGTGEVRFYRFLNYGNQEVRFLVGRDRRGEIQVGFDASDSHSKLGRGFRHEGDWLVDNKCDSAVRLESVNSGGRGCRPVPVEHVVEGDRLVLTEASILRGWRYFR
ncbi:MAG TPA: Fe-S-containing protein [Thermoanaerobaculia bacterium]|nr:Fe-S-containing protein [Thermoanaerobaculia bacterium]